MRNALLAAQRPEGSEEINARVEERVRILRERYWDSKLARERAEASMDTGSVAGGRAAASTGQQPEAGSSTGSTSSSSRSTSSEPKDREEPEPHR